VLGIALLNLAAGLLLRALQLDRPSGTDPRAKAAAYEGADWAERYYEEYEASSEQRYAGFIGWRRRDFAGEHVNVSGGIRRTVESRSQAGAAPLEVFFFGGSTMWGLGSRDAHTIPSEIARLAGADGLPIQATNFGEVAYVSWQEVMLLAERCAAGDVPDLAVFYDGVNDVFVQLQQPTAVPLPQNFASLRDRFEGNGLLARSLRETSAVHILLGKRRAPVKRDLALPAPSTYWPRTRRRCIARASNTRGASARRTDSTC
jgi:hypothetical protein